MADGDELTDFVAKMVESPGGRILSDAAEFLRKRMKLLLVLFILCFVFGFSLTKALISWLIDDSRLPDGVNIIVISPIEYIVLQLQIAASFGLLIIISAVIIEGTFRGLKNESVLARIQELDLKPPKLSLTMISTISSIILLSGLGLLYAWEFLTPMILDYLTTDAQSAGLSTEWRLSGYVGFLVNLTLASMIGFQAPVVTIVVMRMGIVSREEIKLFRKHIWFGAFVLGAFLSPPDPLSLFLVSMPVIILFELALILERFLSN